MSLDQSQLPAVVKCMPDADMLMKSLSGIAVTKCMSDADMLMLSLTDVPVVKRF